MEEIDLLGIIKEYERFVRLSFKIFKATFSIDESPLLAHRKEIIPKQGSIQYEDYSLQYHFHGIGCFCKYNDETEVNFDYRFGSFDYKGFQVGDISLFIQSFETYKNHIEINQLALMLNDLVRKDILKANTAERKIDTYDFYLA